MGSGHGTGFWQFSSYSSVRSIDCPVDMVETYIVDRVLPRLEQRVWPHLNEEQMAEVKDAVEEYYWAETWTVGDTDIALSSCSFEGNESNFGQIYLYLYNFHRMVHEVTKADIVRIYSMYTKTDYSLAQDFTIIMNVKQSFFEASAGTEIQYAPPSLTADRLIHAYSIAFCPVALGLVKCPDGFLKTVKEAVMKNAENPSELPPGYSEEAAAFSSAIFAQMERAQQNGPTQEVQKMAGYDIVAPLGVWF